MALINITSVAGVCLLAYLATFVLLAVIRIATGISVQRIGYFSLRHISFSPREGFRVDLRGLGLSLHRPTFAQPTWVSLVFSELKITVDPATIDNPPSKPNGFLRRTSTPPEKTTNKKPRKDKRSQLWQKLTHVKEQIKRLHRRIKWLRMVDIRADDTSLEVLNVGSVQVTGFTAAVHTRRKLLDRTRLFRHKKDPLGTQKPAEWIFTVRSVLLGVGTNEPVEVLDAMTINIHGLIYRDKEGLRDTSIALKAGRMYIPVDDLLQLSRRSQSLRRRAKEETRAFHTVHHPMSPLSPTSPVSEISLEDVVEELDNPGSREASIVQTVADSKEFFSSILRGVQEIQVGLSFIRVSKELETLRQANLPLMANIVTHEIGIDLHRLQHNTPAHRMYFAKEDVAHQALLAAVSLSVTLDEDDTKSHKLMYIPMATTTIRTTLPSKTMTLSQEQDISERNKNILFANFVVTSPSLDLVPQHIIRLLALLPNRSEPSSNTVQSRHRMVSKLLPKASIKFSVHEPVVRFVLPVADPKYAEPGEFDMIISAISSISLDLESSHSMSGELLYSLASNFRVVSHQLYYQSASGQKHNLVVTENLELKINVSASTEVLVVIYGNLKTFSVLMVREEVSQGIYNIVRHFRRNVEPEKLTPKPKSPQSAFLRRISPWLLEIHLEGSNCSMETAGVDSSISSQTRGVAFELESWNVDYRSQQAEITRSPTSKRKTSTSVRNDESFSHVHHLSPPTSPSRGGRTTHPTDGRRLTMHGRNLEGFVIENLDRWEANPFLSVPRFEVACSTSRDLQSPIFHVHSAVKAVYLEFSLYRFYSIGIAGSVLRDAFTGPVNATQPVSTTVTRLEPEAPPHSRFSSAGQVELTTIDVKASYVRVKASLPADPPLMLQIYNLATGRHRWSAPFLRSELLRLHVQSPYIKGAWARLVTINNFRVDMRHSKKKTASGFVEENSVDVSMDFTRLACPHGLRMYLVFDNIVNTVKSIEQLHHRFRTRTNEYILKKEPKGPAKVPRVSVRSRAFMFELEDDPFEWKLGLIYHVGRVEQKQRLAREAAYKLKVRKLNEERFQRGTSRHRRSSKSRPPSPSASASSTPIRANSPERSDQPRRARSTSRGRSGRSATRIRYDRDGTCAVTNTSKLNADDAWQKLQEHNARSWKKRIDWMVLLQKNTVKNVRKMFTGADGAPHDEHEHESILDIPYRPGLLDIIISDFHLVIDKPSFPLADLPKFLHEVGKGMPYSMQYSLLIPMSLALDMGEARVMLRDYPLNLLHIPAIRSGQPPRLPSWSLRSDFVIAEEWRNDESIRHVKVDIVPKGQQNEGGSEIPGFSIDVRRTVSPVKTYSKPVIDINTSLPTTISWGTSYQPVIQDMMMIIESFTKPEVDPSDRVGFWDKIRLSFHSRLTVNWKGDGDVQLRLKGSRDPYVVTGFGAGFVMCWRNDVQWLIHSDDDPRKFMTVRSGEYVLAIPDYSHEARNAPEMRSDNDADSLTSSSSQRNAAIFQKVIMKVSGNVQWTAGLVFERDLQDGERSSGFRSHYDVVLKNPKQVPDFDHTDYDAFQGFRSNHIHLSVAVAAPFDRDWKSEDIAVSESYNSVHLTPRFFSHFFDWWSLFSGVMSLPIRQGPLWRGPDKSSKKFGRHLATIKYGLLLSPLFIAHVYKHKDAEDYQEDVVSATGLKIRIDSFMLDLHQRREYFDTLSKARSKQMRTSGMKINRAELDFVRADLRALSASIAGTTAEDMKKANAEILSAYQDVAPNVDMSQFEIPDLDFSWIDMDDFVELDWILPAESNPETRILPLAFTPRLTYFRQTEHNDSVQGDQSRTSPFGDEDSHFCVMSTHNDPRRVQMNLIDSRLNDINEKLKKHDKLMGEHELRVVRDGDHDTSLKEAHDSLLQQKIELESKQRFLEHGLKRLGRHAYPGEQTDADQASSRGTSQADEADSSPNPSEGTHIDIDGLFSASHDEFASDFNNRFIIHNIQLKWNNSLRNTILRYSHQVSQRRGFVYYMSRRAVKFILDIVEEQAKAKQAQRKQSGQNIPSMPSVISPTEEKDEDSVIEDRIQQLLNDANRFVNVDGDTDDVDNAPQNDDTIPEVTEGIAESFQPMNSYHLRLIAPQIQLQGEKNTKSVVLVSAKGMQLKIVAIMDKARMSDDVSGLVQRRYALDMDGAQFFVTNQKRLAKYLHLYSGNRYGSPPGSDWPPWVSLEAMFDFHLDPFGFQRVIQKTSARLQYDKYNPLRLKYNEEVGGSKTDHVKNAYGAESRMDQLWVDFPRIRASCDSAQYYTMYIIVLDLLLYSEPLEKTRSERLEKIMLASDFSDLRGAPEMAERLQERIRQLEELKLHFQINAKYLDKQGWEDRIHLEKDLASCEDELFFIMKAINTSQQRNEDRKDSDSNAFLRWYLSASEIVWHLMRDKDEPLLEFQLGRAVYERIDNSDGSNHNAMEIQHIRGWNLLKTALYPEIIGPYYDESSKRGSIVEHQKMLQIHWYMLEAIAGIPVLEEFQVTMHPLKVQLERELGKRLFEYIFPGIGSSAFESGNFSPLNVKNMEPLGNDDDSESEQARLALTPNPELQPTNSEMRRTSSPGAMGRRLKPTYNLNYGEKSPTSTKDKDKERDKGRGLGISSEHAHRLFRRHDSSSSHATVSQTPVPVRKTSASSLRSFGKTAGSSTSLSALALSSQQNADTPSSSRWHLHRSGSHEQRSSTKSTVGSKGKPTDDVSQMLSRASNYMTLAHVKLDSFVLCLSYKGKGERNIEDLHDFVFRMPTLEYTNKTWSNLDLALRLKKDVIRALISHTGAIIGNKFSHHRPNKKAQDRLREMANSSTLIPNTDSLRNVETNYTTSESASLYSFSQDNEESPRRSFQTDHTGPSTKMHANGHKVGGSSPFESAPSSTLLRAGSWSHVGPGLQVPSKTATPNGSGTASPIPPAMRQGWGQREDSQATIRPSTSGAVGPSIGKSLLKDAFGRHFSNAGDSMKGRVRFGPLGGGLMSDVRSISGSSSRERRGSESIGPDDKRDGDDGEDSDGDGADGESGRRKSVLMLGRKVLGKLS
ncbi:uncharacterized protein HMPREF1541_03627 [Cyphellophora europaea CBS 101466]|uniref:FMP27 GFWDK domain-containing protein n=1 Tax=Cyphellophora europaea (strain CBS 101466) TaxID=1220924 RepID=W2RYV6_CYPE1|nr:uncharacterized protein HMPREF1541_03627 [Cyphellophora europaea CBS 101466]ETN41691.1 hypothetical protein HMPREF1541_03627 [Cyphellophora europaea CBS 101466]